MASYSRISPNALVVFLTVHSLLLMAIMAIGRFAMVSVFAEPRQLDGQGTELWAMWRIGTLFDVRTALIGISPLFLLGLASCFFDRARKLASVVQKIWSPFLFFAVAAASVTNYYYFQTFNSEIDISIFGLINDDTKAVMTSVLKDYPFLRIILLVAFVTALFAWLTRNVWRVCQQWKPPQGILQVSFSAVSIVVFTFVSVAGARGTTHSVPLRQHDRMVSNISLLNKAVPNGLMALKWAYDNYHDAPQYLPVTQQEGRDLALAAIGRDELIDKTPENTWLAKNPPHVVMVIMESFGSNLLEFDNPGTLDLLGSFRTHMKEDFLFTRFISEERFTMPGLMRLLFSCPDESITRSEFKTKKLGGSAFETFKQNGYETVFIYPGHGSWHDLRSYMSAQEVDRTYFLNDFFEFYKTKKPDISSEVLTWGLPDEWIFGIAQELLEKSDKPMFLVILTLTNHSPYIPPQSISGSLQADPNEDLMAKLNGKKSIKMDMLRTYPYSSNCVGDFVSAIKEGTLANNTVIAAFGDHRMPMLKPVFPNDILLNRAVPLYLYIPKPILANVSHSFVPDRPGSHKDIMPTLYSLSLSGTSYYSVGGRNLLAVQDDPSRTFGYHSHLFINADGACALGNDFSNSWYAYEEGMYMDKNPRSIPKAVTEKIRSYEQLYRWQINARIAGTKEN